jgi:tetratricopeptide (TPR) repeat protein
MSMHLFHHITVFSLNEQEKRAFLEAGVEFTRAMKTSQGETVTFEIGEDDPQYERVAALLKSLGAERVQDFSMTVPTLREFVKKMVAGGGERLKQEAAMQAQWERGREVLRQSNHSGWALILYRHAAVISRLMGDRERQIHYEEQALPLAPDYSFAAYNFAQLLLSDGQLVRAEHYAAEAYRQSIPRTTGDDRDLIAAILRQWPNIAQTV